MLNNRHSLWSRAAVALSYPLSPADYLQPLIPVAHRAGHGIITSIEQAAADTATLTLRPYRSWPVHRAGQYVNVGVDIDGVRHWRCYSISSAPERADDLITITVKATPGGRVSTYLVNRLWPADVLYLGTPAGDFVLPDALPDKLLFIAAGSGITPIMSLLASLDAQGPLPDVTLIHSASSPEAMIFGCELAVLAARQPRLRLLRYYTRSGSRAGDKARRFAAEHLPRVLVDWRERQTWACGPEPLLQSLEQFFAQAGLPDRLHVERFRAAARVAVGTSAASGRVSFTRSGLQTIGHSDQTLLDLAEAAGLTPDHGCRMGICHRCTATLQAGGVRDLRNGTTHDEEGDRVQLCICAPVGDVAIDL